MKLPTILATLRQATTPTEKLRKRFNKTLRQVISFLKKKIQALNIQSLSTVCIPVEIFYSRLVLISNRHTCRLECLEENYNSNQCQRMMAINELSQAMYMYYLLKAFLYH